MMLRQFARRSFSSAGHVPIRQTQLFINNKFVDAADGKTFDTFDPATEKKLASVQEANEEDVNRAVAAARKAFDDGPWRRMSGAERGRLMYKLADLIEANIDELSALEAMDNGKPVAEARHADLELVLKTYRYYAGWADKIHGQTIPLSTDHFCYSRMEPVGVCAQIIPWNFPLAMMAWKLGPALATGCTVVMKPAEQTPLTALRVAELAAEAGYPEGVLNLLPGFGATAGASLMKHKDVDKVAFTGSTSVGYEIMRNSHVDNLKRVTLELGGKSANIVMDDADMELALDQTETGIFLNQGQCCIAGSRVFVHEKVYDEFLEKAAKRAASRRVGDPFSPDTNQGAQIDQKQFDKILSYVDQGKSEGAELVTGGTRVGDKGYFVEPTIFAGVKDDMKIAREEIFGPVMSVLKFSDTDEVIRRANDSEYGLGAGLVTQSMDNILKITHGIRTGTVYVNCYDVFDANTPFGGYKDSGIGRELGEPGLKNYLEHKTVIIKRPDGCLP